MSTREDTVAIRPVRPEDVPAVVAMVHDLAEYEKTPEQCRLTPEQLHRALFPESGAAALFGHVATVDGVTQGFSLWFLNYSTWEGTHGIYLEDLYVRPGARGCGAGRALLAALAEECMRKGYLRVDWSVLHWNPARDFYHAIGAEHQTEWLPYRLTGVALHRLAAHDLPAGS